MGHTINWITRFTRNLDDQRIQNEIQNSDHGIGIITLAEHERTAVRTANFYQPVHEEQQFFLAVVRGPEELAHYLYQRFPTRDAAYNRLSDFRHNNANLGEVDDGEYRDGENIVSIPHTVIS